MNVGTSVIAINDLLDGKTDTGNNSVFLGFNAGLNDNDTLIFNTGIGANNLLNVSSI